MNDTDLNAIPSPRGASALDTLDAPRVNRVIAIIGRIALAGLFLPSSVYHLTVGFGPTTRDMAAHGVPFPEVLDVVAMIIAASLALAVLFNVKTRWATLGLALYTLCVSMVMFGPFNADWVQTRMLFVKDMGVFGALLAWSCALSTEARLRAGVRSGSNS